MIKEYLKNNGLSKTIDIANAIGLSSTRTRAILKEMPDLIYEGKTNSRKYRLVDKD